MFGSWVTRGTNQLPSSPPPPLLLSNDILSAQEDFNISCGTSAHANPGTFGVSHNTPSQHLDIGDDLSPHPEEIEAPENNITQERRENNDAQIYETIDENGILTKKVGRFLVKDVYYLNNEKIVVNYNDEFQLIGKGANIFGHYVGHVVRKDNLLGLSYLLWKEVPQRKIDELLAVIRAKFYLPSGEDYNRLILLNCTKKWSDWKYELRKTATKKFTYSKEATLANKPAHLDERGWRRNVQYWYSSQFERKSIRGKASQAAKMHIHVTGAKSFARLRHELEKKLNRKIGPVEFFKICHKKKDGTYAHPQSKEYIELATKMVHEKTDQTSFCEDTIMTEKEIHFQLRGSDNRGRVKGYGLGALPSKHNRRMHIATGCNSNSDHNIHEVVKGMREENLEQKSIIGELKAQMTAMQEQIAKFQTV